MRPVHNRFVMPMLAALLTVGLTGCSNTAPGSAASSPAATESSQRDATSALRTTHPASSEPEITIPLKASRTTRPALVSTTTAAEIVVDGTQTVVLLSYNTASGKAVVQPAEVKAGDQDNAKVLRTGGRVTVSVNATVKLFTVNGGDPSCMEGSGYDVSGSCLTTKAKFQKLIVGEHGLPVRIATTQGRIHEMSELYLP